MRKGGEILRAVGTAWRDVLADPDRAMTTRKRLIARISTALLVGIGYLGFVAIYRLDWPSTTDMVTFLMAWGVARAIASFGLDYATVPRWPTWISSLVLGDVAFLAGIALGALTVLVAG